MERKDDDEYGPTFTIRSKMGNTLSIQRNTALGREPGSGRRFYVRAFDANYHQSVGLGFTEEDLLEFFAAFLAINETYEEEK